MIYAYNAIRIAFLVKIIKSSFSYFSTFSKSMLDTFKYNVDPEG